jgi:hypothetical protein
VDPVAPLESLMVTIGNICVAAPESVADPVPLVRVVELPLVALPVELDETIPPAAVPLKWLVRIQYDADH